MMPTIPMPVAARIAEIKKIFHDFGIPVAPNSILEQAITTEFGRGKKSILTKIVTDLQPDSNAAVLAECIGHALAQEQGDPYIQAVANVMKVRIPSLLQICDIRAVTTRRIELLQQLLLHFEGKIQGSISDGSAIHEQRLLRMLAGAREQLHAQQQLQAISRSITNAGIVCDVRELQQFGKILQAITPLLVAIDHNGSKQQIANQCVNAVRLLAQELQSKKLEKAASILEDVHLLALVNFPKITEPASVQQVLESLGISIGVLTTHKVSQAARARGLTEKELVQVLYSGIKNSKIAVRDQDLLRATEQNKRFAASCGLISKLGAEVECKALQQIGIAGMCLVCMRQTYYEVKTSNTNIAGFSESLGLFLTGVGALSKNQTISKLGTCILTGVKTYAGLMAIPGVQSVAIPLAICATVGKLVLGDRRKISGPEEISDHQLLQHIVQQIINLHLDMRLQFKGLFALLEEQHREILNALEDGFTQLAKFLQLANKHTNTKISLLDAKLNILQFSITAEFRDLYLEYIQDPLDELEFHCTYNNELDKQRLQKHKFKLCMWLLYKSKHEKANGKALISHHESGFELTKFIELLLRKISDCDSVLGMFSRYLNIEFNTCFEENLPHAPTWLLCVDAYLYILQNSSCLQQDPEKEAEIIKDIVAVGAQLVSFIEQLAHADRLQVELTKRISASFITLQQQRDTYAYFAERSIFLSALEVCNELAQGFTMQKIMATPAADQLEQFDGGMFELDDFWDKHLKPHVPLECFAAQRLGLGTIIFNYAVDPEVNGFHEPHVQCGAALPEIQRDVIFRVDVLFLDNHQNKTLLMSGWCCYDLQTAQRRFDEYYRCKFKYGLQHSRYLWIGLNGRQNRVIGHGVSETTKLIDYQRLGSIYRNWWHMAVPVHTAEYCMRLQQSQRFIPRTGTMLANSKCVQIRNLELLKLQLLLGIQQKLQELRLKCIAEFRNSNAVQQGISKIDAYLAVSNAMQSLINSSVLGKLNLESRLYELCEQVEEDASCSRSFCQEFDAILQPPTVVFAKDQYADGSLYQRIQLAISKLSLLLGSINPALRLI